MSASRRPLVGYYVHHQGRGHLHRALALGRELRRRGLRVVFLSSLEPPVPAPARDGGAEEWVLLPRDDDGDTRDASPGGLLHWAPRHHPGLRARTAAVSGWIGSQQPDLVVSDVSQEITLLCRLHGVPVVSVVLPGDRGDTPHRWGLGVSDGLVGFWPPTATRMVSGLPPETAAMLVPVGALSRFPPSATPVRRAGPGRSRRLLVLSGRGGDAWTGPETRSLRAGLVGWRLSVLGPDSWVEDPWPHLLRADVVVTRAGQSSVAEVAAARVPAVVVPARRPHAEQAHTAAQLAAGPWPAVVASERATAPDVLAAARLDGSAWSSWCDGQAARRFGDVVAGVLSRDRSGRVPVVAS